MRSRSLPLAAAITLGAILLMAPGSHGAAQEPTQRVTAQLIWGTDGPKPTDKELKAVSADVDRRLRRIFKWKNYYEISRTNFVFSRTQPAKVDMSSDCRIEVVQEAGGEVEIQLFGKGKLVVKKRQRIVRGETVVLAGDDKDDNAWFVLVGPQRGSD